MSQLELRVSSNPKTMHTLLWLYTTVLLDQPATTSGSPHATTNPSKTRRKALGLFCMQTGRDRKLMSACCLGERQKMTALDSSAKLWVDRNRPISTEKKELVLLLIFWYLLLNKIKTKTRQSVIITAIKSFNSSGKKIWWMYKATHTHHVGQHLPHGAETQSSLPFTKPPRSFPKGMIHHCVQLLIFQEISLMHVNKQPCVDEYAAN